MVVNEAEHVENSLEHIENSLEHVENTSEEAVEEGQGVGRGKVVIAVGGWSGAAGVMQGSWRGQQQWGLEGAAEAGQNWHAQWLSVHSRQRSILVETWTIGLGLKLCSMDVMSS